MKPIIVLFFISSSIYADPIKISSSDSSKFDCSGINNDYYTRNNINPDRVTYNQSFMDKLTEKENELYVFLKNKVPNHYYSSEESAHSPGYFFNKYYFEYQGDKIVIYRSISNAEKKTIGFCFEGKFNSEIARKFFSAETIGKIQMIGDGDFYLTDDAYSVVKFVKKNNSIEEVYIYIDYD